MTDRRRRDTAVVIGGAESFERFFEREAGEVLAVALLVAPRPDAAEDATQRAFSRALREWPRLGTEPDAATRVRRWAFDRAWPSTRRRRGDPRGGEAAGLRAALWSMPRSRSRLAALAVARGEPLLAVDELTLPVVVGSSPERVAMSDLAARLGEATTPQQVAEAVAEIRLRASSADLGLLRPGAPARWGPSALALAAVGAAVIATLAMLRVDRPPPEDAATPTTRPPATGRSGPIVVDEPPWWLGDRFGHGLTLDVSMPGWEPLADLGTVWVHGATPLGERVFAWVESREPAFPPRMFSEIDGLIYDPAADRWTDVAALPDTVCEVYGVRALVEVDGELLTLFWGGDPFDGLCATAAVYSPDDDEWTPLSRDFFSPPVSHPLVWTGELLVAPAAAQAYHWGRAETVSIPPIAVSVVGEVDAHWTGTEVLAVGHFGVRAWAPGDDEWRVVDETAVFNVDRGTAWTDAGLLMAVRGTFGFLDEEGWRDSGFQASDACWGVVVRSTTPIIQHCGGYSVWDEARESWVPFPPHGLNAWGSLVVVGDHWYAFGDGAYRASLTREAGGSIVVPATIPIGHVFFDIPAGFTFVEASRSAALSAQVAGSDAWGVTLEGLDGSRCTVVSAFHQGRGAYAPEGMEPITDRPVGRPGLLPDMHAVLFTDGVGAVSLVIEGDLLPYASEPTKVVTCEHADTEVAGAHAITLAGALWSPAEGSFSASAPFTRELLVERDDFSWGFSAPATDPHRQRTESALAIFASCLESQMGPDFRLRGLQMLVDADGELLSIFYQGVRLGGWPPVGVVPGPARDRCLDRADVSTAYMESVRAWPP
jgi:hypothetical protein